MSVIGGSQTRHGATTCERGVSNEPRELRDDAIDQAFSRREPPVAPPNELGVTFVGGGGTEQTHEIDAVPDAEERAAVRALDIDESVEDEVPEYGEQLSDPLAHARSSETARPREPRQLVESLVRVRRDRA